jgi:hypothetical protein
MNEESYDAHKYRLSQAEELLRSLGYQECPTPDGTVWERAEDDAVESARGEGGPEEKLFVGHVHVEIRADASGAHVMSFSWDWNEALLAQSTAAQIIRHEMSDKWTLDFAETLTNAGFAGIYRIYFYVMNTADGRRVDILSGASGRVLCDLALVFCDHRPARAHTSRSNSKSRSWMDPIKGAARRPSNSQQEAHMPTNETDLQNAPRVPVSRRALIRRISRSLRKDDQWLRTCRGAGVAPGPPSWIGRYYVVNADNIPVEGDVDLEEFGRELGVLKPHERLVEEEVSR